MRDDDSLATTVLRTLIGLGCVWCGAVLSLAFGHAEHVRWWSLLAGSPLLTVVGLSIFASPSPRREKTMLALTVSSGVVLVFCVGLVLAGLATLSEEGRWKRALAAGSAVAIVLEVRRLAPSRRSAPRG